ncbi:hypothetical protein TYRP_022028 [Tyrophagus putrescentiae]|nr:hypothetical protein TYRP_022028 [Tyrophagus putrescentiae]
MTANEIRSKTQVMETSEKASATSRLQLCQKSRRKGEDILHDDDGVWSSAFGSSSIGGLKTD